MCMCMKKISVIIPVYNNIGLLDRCIKSIASQTFVDWEAIFVNDGSTDGSGEVLDSWAEKDERIKVLHQKNQGVSCARNAGLEKASAPYVTMIDADDEVVSDMFQQLYSVMIEKQVDMVICGVCRKSRHKATYSFPRITEGYQPASPKHIFTCFHPGPFAKLYRREILESFRIRFPRGVVMGEDYIFVATYWQYTKSVYVLKKALYIYYENESSVTSRFIEGKLPFSIYETTLMLHPMVLKMVKHNPKGVHNLGDWSKALFRNQLVEADWVIQDVKHPIEQKCKLKEQSKRLFSEMAVELSLFAVLKLVTIHRINWMRGRLARLLGKVKRYFTSYDFCRKGI